MRFKFYYIRIASLLPASFSHPYIVLPKALNVFDSTDHWSVYYKALLYMLQSIGLDDVDHSSVRIKPLLCRSQIHGLYKDYLRVTPYKVSIVSY